MICRCRKRRRRLYARGCTNARRLGRAAVRRLAPAEQPRQNAHLARHRLQRPVNRTAPRRVAGRPRAHPVIGTRGTEGVGAHPLSPLRCRSIGSSTGIHGSPCRRMNKASVKGRGHGPAKASDSTPQASQARLQRPERSEVRISRKDEAAEAASQTKNGRGDRIRTRGPRFWRPMLYQLSYTPALAEAAP